MRLLTYTGLWSMLGFGFWVIEDRATGAFAGEAGFAEFRRGIDPTLEGVPEVGWAIVPAMHGRGYATEAVRAAGAWGDVHLASSRTVCIITNGNDPSFGVAAKCGFRSYGSAVSNERPITLFERFR
jgi:RimJ/RimL family protein N-acetyltransferase